MNHTFATCLVVFVLCILSNFAFVFAQTNSSPASTSSSESTSTIKISSTTLGSVPSHPSIVTPLGASSTQLPNGDRILSSTLMSSTENAMIPKWLLELEEKRKLVEEEKKQSEDEADELLNFYSEGDGTEEEEEEEGEEGDHQRSDKQQTGSNTEAPNDKSDSQNKESNQQQHEQQQQQQQQQQQHQSESSPSEPEVDSADASSSVVLASSSESQVASFDVSERVYQQLLASEVFTEMTNTNAWHFVTQNRPFALLILCRCHNDDDWNLRKIEELLHAKGLVPIFSFLFVQPHIAHHFQMYKTYGISDIGDKEPHLIIDNIPIGQHVEKYRFLGKLSNPKKASPEQIVDFFSQFIQAPTPLPLIIRSVPLLNPQINIAREIGKATDINGDTFPSVVLESDYHILALLYAPTCPASQNALPVMDKVAQSLAMMQPDVRVVKMDRTVNDVNFVLKIEAFPALYLFPKNHKYWPHSLTTETDRLNQNQFESYNRRGETTSRGIAIPLNFHGPEGFPRQADSCSAPLSEDDVIAFLRKHTIAKDNLLSHQTIKLNMPTPDSTADDATAKSKTHNLPAM